MSLGKEDPETEDNRIGTATHWVGESMLHSACAKEWKAPTIHDYIGKIAPNGVVIDAEMADCAYLYYRTVMNTAGHGHLGILNIEKRVAAERVHPDCWGTPDADLYVGTDKTLYLWDYKHGHRSVVPYENPQLVIYLIGRMKEYGLIDTETRCVVTVVQPRCYDGRGPVRTWTVNAAELRGQVNQLSAAAHEALGPNPQLRAGLHCRDCAARFECPANLQSTMWYADYAQDSVPMTISDVALAYEIQVLQKASSMVKHRLDALESEALARLRRGALLPGFNAEQGYGNKAWTVPTADVLGIGDVFGVDLRGEPSVLTPTQSIAEFKAAGLDPQLLNGLYDRRKTAMKLVVDDGESARRAFQQQEK